ncbi:MAG: sigma-70 family RNA polymerase sigma factor [Planctomycetota bacterium]
MLQRSEPLRHTQGVTVEQDFARWLDERDADALARVFDATGRRLLLLAAHLVDGASAGDLVQATFLAAMTRGASWDRRRPLQPWLAGVLQNEARMRRRSQRRRREVQLDDDGQALAARSPTLLESEEVLQHVLRAMDALPLAYRQVLKLRLVHDLQPVEIARSLEIPVGTVRSQLHRGLARLRAALPASIASAVALCIGNDALLAQARQHVLQSAKDLSTAASPRTPTGATGTAILTTLPWFVTMKAKLLAATGAALVALLLLVSLDEGPPDAPPSAQPGPGAIPRSAVAAAAQPDPPVDREQLVSSAAAAWQLTVTVCDRAGTGIPDAAVDVWIQPRTGSYWNRSSQSFLRDDLASGRTDAAGIFRHDLAALREPSAVWRATNTLWVEARLADAAPRTQGIALATLDETRQLRTRIVLQRGRAVVGRVLDADGRPLEDARVQATATDASVRVADGRSRRDGSFHIAIDDEAPWPARIALRHDREGTAQAAIPAGDPGALVCDVGEIRLDPGAAIRGRAVLGDGSLIAGIQIELDPIALDAGDDLASIKRWLRNRSRAERRKRTKTTTDEDGRFRFSGLTAGGRYLVKTWGVRPVHQVVRPSNAAIELLVDQQLLTVAVVDGDGAAVPGAAVALDGFDPSASNPSWSKREGIPAEGQVCGNWIPCGDDAGNRVLLTPFGFVWSVYASDDSLHAATTLHRAQPGVYRATAQLTVAPETQVGALHVTAFDSEGRQVQAGVALHALDRDLYHDHRRRVPDPDGLRCELPAGRWRVEAVLGKELIYLHGNGGFARGHQQHEVLIEPGKTAELRLEAPTAGLVSFELSGTGLKPDTWRALRVEHLGRPVEVLPVEPREPRPATRHRAAVRRLVSRGAFAPGPHTFLIRGEGFHDATVHVEVVADALAKATVQLFPR